MPWGDKAFDAWVRIAIKKLMCSVASEVHPETSVIEFGGPPRIVLTSAGLASPATLGADGFRVLQDASKWIYEFDREVETRHKLFSIELARSVSPGTDVSLAFRNAAAAALEGARIAHGFGLVELSKEALKSMADLRKTVAEDTTKLSEAMRQLSLGVAAALFYGLALVAARLAAVVSPFLLDAMAVVGAAYVGTIVLVNWRHLSQQKTLRDRWREKFYRFLRADDYKSMVSEPLDAAERSLKVSMWISSIITLIFFVAVVVHNHQSL